MVGIPILLRPLVLDVLAVGECLGYGHLISTVTLTRLGHKDGERSELTFATRFACAFV